jgi:hypothetical protein
MSMDESIPKEKYGKRLIFSRKALNEWVQARTISKTSTDEIMTEAHQRSFLTQKGLCNIK